MDPMEEARRLLEFRDKDTGTQLIPELERATVPGLIRFVGVSHSGNPRAADVARLVIQEKLTRQLDESAGQFSTASLALGRKQVQVGWAQFFLGIAMLVLAGVQLYVTLRPAPRPCLESDGGTPRGT